MGWRSSVLLLEERGTLSLSDPIGKHLPNAPKSWAAVTVFHLLTHTSGLASLTAGPGSGSAAPVTTADLIAPLRERPLESAPGEKFSYSNSGYLSPRTPGAGLASGYTVSQGGPVTAAAVNPAMAFSAGALYSTTEDLLRWERGLFGGTLLSSASLQKMVTPFMNDYALGVEVRTRNGKRAIEHSGGIGAFRSMLAYYPDDKVTVVVLGNMGSLASAGTLAKYVGRYAMRDFELVITVEDGRLLSQIGTQPKAVLVAESETKFASKEADQRIEFISDAGGTVTST